MKRTRMSRHSSRRDFRKKTGVHGLNNLNPRNFRGGIRL